MTLQGPHQVAKQSRTIKLSFSATAVSKSALLRESVSRKFHQEFVDFRILVDPAADMSGVITYAKRL